MTHPSTDLLLCTAPALGAGGAGLVTKISSFYNCGRVKTPTTRPPPPHSMLFRNLSFSPKWFAAFSYTSDPSFHPSNIELGGRGFVWFELATIAAKLLVYI